MQLLLRILGLMLLIGTGYLIALSPRLSRKGGLKKFHRCMFAHRGYHNSDALIPENSMAAFQAAVANGYGIELDLHATKDGHTVVFHDDTLLRMCGKNQKVEHCTLAELKQLHLQNTTQKIPEFSEVLSYIDGRVPLLIELKIPENDLTVCQTSYQLLKDYKGDFLIQSFNTLGLRWYRRQAPHILRGQLSSDLTASNKETPYPLRFLVKHLLLNLMGRPDFISYQFSDLPSLSVFLCQKLFRLPIAVWTLRSEQALREARQRYQMYIFEKINENY